MTPADWESRTRELAGAAAHELNQPLTSVMGYAQMLMRKMGPGDTHIPTVRTILEEAERMAAAGMASLFPIEDLAVMGIAEVVPRIPRILGRLRETAAAIEKAIKTIDGVTIIVKIELYQLSVT